MNTDTPTMIHLDQPISVQVLDERAVIPRRVYPDDVGVNITPIGVFKQLRNDTWLLNTGLAISPPKGTYLDLVGRSSVSKTPVHIANAFGVMEPKYRGDFLIAVTPKVGVDLETFDPESLITGLPIAQIVLRPFLTADVEVVDKLDETERGDGGFGSTDEKLKQDAQASALARKADASGRLSGSESSTSAMPSTDTSCNTSSISCSE